MALTQVTTGMIADANITAAKILDANVTTAKIAAAAITPANMANTGFEFGMHNRIINGAMVIWQRGTTFTLPANSTTYIADRFYGLTTVASLWSTPQVNSGNLDLPFAMRLQRIAGQTSTAAITVRQIIETANCAGLAGQNVTLSFYATAGANYSGGAATASIVTGTSADQGATLLNSSTWTGIATPLGSAFTPTATRTRFTFTVPLGATVQEVAIGISWSGTGTAGANDYIDITGVQLEAGSTVTPFERRPVGLEYFLCQRYYYVGTATSYGYPCPAVGGYAYNQRYDFKSTMRATPTVSTTYSSQSNVSSVNASTRTIDGFTDQIVGAGLFNVSWTTAFTATAEL